MPKLGKRERQPPFGFSRLLPAAQLFGSFGTTWADAQCAEMVSAPTPVSY